MKVELAGPYKDDETGKIADERLERIMLSKHPIADKSRTGRLVVGHCDRTTGKCLIYYPGISAIDKSDIHDWAVELINELMDSDD